MKLLFEEEEWNYKLVVVPIILLFTTFVIWASIAEIDEVVRGQGKVIPSGKNKIIQHLEGGIVSKIFIKEGDKVKKGQVLFELKQEFFTADLKTKEIKLKALEAKAIRILNEIDFNKDLNFPQYLINSIPEIIESEKRAFEAETNANMAKIKIAKDQLKQKILKKRELESKKENLEIELRLARENMKILDKMYKRGAISKQKYLKALQQKQSLITKVAQITNTLPVLQREIDEAISKVKNTKNEIKSKLLEKYSKVQIEISALKQIIEASKDRNKRKTVISPVDGIIQKLYVNTIGGIIRPGDKLAEITPNDESLIIEAKIKPSDRAFVYPKQPVKIAITAYDTSKFGLIDGEVLYVSPDSETDPKTGAMYYKVYVKSKTKEFAKGMPILPGMVARINILTGKKTIMQYLIEPIKNVAINALGEK